MADLSYINVSTATDMNAYIEAYRRSGIETILEEQIEEERQKNADAALSALGTFLDLLIEHHDANRASHIEEQHKIYMDIKNMVATLLQDSQLSEYSDFLQTKLDALSVSISHPPA